MHKVKVWDFGPGYGNGLQLTEDVADKVSEAAHPPTNQPYLPLPALPQLARLAHILIDLLAGRTASLPPVVLWRGRTWCCACRRACSSAARPSRTTTTRCPAPPCEQCSTASTATRLDNNTTRQPGREAPPRHQLASVLASPHVARCVSHVPACLCGPSLDVGCLPAWPYDVCM